MGVEQKQQGYTTTDNNPRCGACVVYGGGAQTPLILSTVQLNISNSAPFVPIAQITKCPQCFKIYGIKILNNTATRFGFTLMDLENALKKTHGEMIYLSELKTEKLFKNYTDTD